MIRSKLLPTNVHDNNADDSSKLSPVFPLIVYKKLVPQVYDFWHQPMRALPEENSYGDGGNGGDGGDDAFDVASNFRDDEDDDFDHNASDYFPPSSKPRDAGTRYTKQLRILH